MKRERAPLPGFPGYSVDGIHRAGAAYKARIVRARRGDLACIIKDLTPMRPLFRWLYGRRMLRREAAMLEKLAGFAAAPRLVERIGRDAIAVERVATRYKYLRKKIPPAAMPGVLAALGEAVAGLHRRGIVHLDLRQRKNILVPADDRVVLIDFESARDLGTGFLGRRVLMPLLGRIDRAAVLKWRVKFTPDQVSEEERRRLRRHDALKRLWPWKALGRLLRRCFRSDGTARLRPERPR